METIKHKIEITNKIEGLLLKIDNYKKNNKIVDNISVEYIIELCNLLDNYNKLHNTNINDFKMDIKNKLSIVDNMDNRIYKISDKMFKIKEQIVFIYYIFIFQIFSLFLFNIIFR